MKRFLLPTAALLVGLLPARAQLDLSDFAAMPGAIDGANDMLYAWDDSAGAPREDRNITFDALRAWVFANPTNDSVTVDDFADDDWGPVSISSNVLTLDTGGITVAQLAAWVVGETGSGALVLAEDPTIDSPSIVGGLSFVAGPSLEVTGSDPNNSLDLRTEGAGVVNVGHAGATTAQQVHVFDGGADNLPGQLALYDDAGNAHRLWVDTAGSLRFGAGAVSDDDTDGSALGGGFDSTGVDATTWSDGANASNVWTFDVSGTDHTMTAGDDSMAFSGGVVVGGALVTAGVLDATGAVDMDYGSGDVTDHTFVSDGGTVVIDGDITSGGDLLPSADSTDDIGADANRWANGYFDAQDITTLQATTLVFEGILDMGTWEALDDTGTPSVSSGSVFETGGTTTITDFDDGVEGQVIYVQALHSLTFDVTGTDLQGGTTDITAADGDTLVWASEDGTIWKLVSFIDASVDVAGGGAETNSLETTISGIADGEIFIGDGADSGNFIAPTGDVTIDNAGATTIAGNAVTTGKILDDEILEADLDATNAPTDNYFLTADTGSGGFTWASTAAFDFTPSADSAFELGTTGLRWSNLWADEGTITTLTTTTTNVGDSASDGTLNIWDDDAGGDAVVVVQAPDALGTTWTLTLPPNNGNAGQILETDGNGVATWEDAGAADNLGNHTATTDLLMSTFAIQFGIDAAAPAGSVLYHSGNAGGMDYNVPTGDVHDFMINGSSQATVGASGVVTATTFVGDLTGNADTVTTNANLTGDVTSTGNATTIASGAVDTPELAGDAVDGTKIEDNAVGNEHLADDAVGLAELAAEAQFQSWAVADLGDTATPSVLTTNETNNKLISNYKVTGADHVFTMPAAHVGGNITFVIGDEFQVDIEPNSSDLFYLNGTAMAADEHIQNTSDTLMGTIVGVCVNVNGTLRWSFKSDDSNWVEATP